MKRNTIQKELVLNAVRELSCHSTAEEVYQKVYSVHPSISKGTVYRNLNSLADDGEIYRVEVPGEADHFDHVVNKHSHMICMGCKRVFDVDMDPIPSMIDKIHDNHGFEYLGYDIVFKGFCPKCKEENK